jgi:hypothetical protein
VSWRLRVKFGLAECLVLQSRFADSSATPTKDPNVHRAMSPQPSRVRMEEGWTEQHEQAFPLTSADLLMEELEELAKDFDFLDPRSCQLTPLKHILVEGLKRDFRQKA